MHELSIAQGIVDVVEARAVECNAAHVKGVRIQIGEAIGIVKDSLTFCFEMLTSLEPTLTGAQLFVDIVPHRGRCLQCDTEFRINDFIAQCPACQKWDIEIVSGTELQVLEMEFEAS